MPKNFSALRKGGSLSIRKPAQATGIPKSSVERHRKALEERTQWPEASFWEQEAGYQWLRLLVFAVIFVFGIKGVLALSGYRSFFTALAKVVGVSFHFKPARLEEKRAQAYQRLSVLQAKDKDTHVQQRFIAHLNEAVATLRADQANAQAALRR